MDNGQEFREEARLASLHSYKILDTPNEERFDRIVRPAARLFGSPIALISLVDRDRQWFKASVGLDVKETPRNISFCTHAIEQREVFVVADAAGDSRFADSPLVTGEPRIGFYAGAPLIAPDGHALGTLCVIDREPWSEFPDFAKEALKDYSAAIIDWMEADRKLRWASDVDMFNHTILDNIQEGIVSFDENGRILSFNTAAGRILGYDPAEILGQDIKLLIPGLEGQKPASLLSRNMVSGDGRPADLGREVMGRRKDGSALPLKFAVTEMASTAGPLFAGFIRSARAQ